ncbi:MAG: hypothetical protein WBO04_08165 [Steroidobacteraceae bacterium]
MRGLNLLAALAVAFTDTIAADEPATAEVARLTFAWPPGTAAQVETTRQRTRLTGEKESTFSANARYRMHVQSHKDGLLVAYSDFETPTVAGDDENRKATLEAILQKVSAVAPSIVVSPEAELLRVENVKELREQMQSVFEPMIAEMKDAPPQLNAMMRNALSEQSLTASAAQDWNALVGAWAGAEFEQGATYVLTTDEPLPMIPGTTVPMSYEFGFVEKVPCTRAAESPACVVLQMNSSPEPQAMRNILDEFMRKMTRGSAASQGLFESLDVVSTIVVVMEPATMLPYRLETEKRVEGTVRAPGEEPQVVTQVDEQVTTFSYLD